MDDKAKLFVFSKKEVALIFLFMILASVTSFVMGVKIGTEFSYQTAGYSSKDKNIVELNSTEEEAANELTRNRDRNPPSEAQKFKSEKDLNSVAQKAIQSNLEKEFSEQDKKFNEGAKEPAPTKEEAPKKEMQQSESKPEPYMPKKKTDGYTGKYTVQFASYDNIDEAKEFADGFKVRGYNPIINKVELANKGTWYRVSIGAFDSVAETKDYILREQSLFQGQDYVIIQFE